MKLAVAVLNIGGKSLPARSRHSMLDACRRWGAEFVEIKEQIVPGVHHFWQKAFVCETLSRFDRVLQLDADMMVRWDAPSPFDLVPKENFGVVSARQLEIAVPRQNRGKFVLDVQYMCGHRDRCVQSWARRMNMKPCPDSRHLNGGFFLYSPAEHQWLWDRLKGFAEQFNFSKALLPEQASMSVLLWNTQCPQTWLPSSFNLTAAGDTGLRPRHSTFRMNGYIYHYTGRRGREKRMAGQHWTREECDAIAERLPLDGTMIEVGVQWGANAVNVLSRRPAAHLTLVDTWGLHDKERYTGKTDMLAGRPQEVYDRWQATATRTTRHHGTEVIKGRSIDVAKTIQDASVDMVYIDADHCEQAVREDIEAWLPKVKPGGWLGGHDYNPPKSWHAGIGVAPAVRALLPGHETDVSCTWWWRVPE